MNGQTSPLHSFRAATPSSLAESEAYAVVAYACPVQAGWPSPAEDYLESSLDLNRLLVKNQPSTFVVSVAGDSMTGIGIHDGDRLIVDKSLPVRPGKVVIASVGGEFTVKTVERRGKRVFLVPHAEGYPEIEITEREDALVWGVVTYVLHPV